MGNSTVLVLTSTRKQDFEMCRYLLIDYFPKFVAVNFVSALAIALDCIGVYLVRKGSLSSAHHTTFPFHGGQATYIPDQSYAWDSFGACEKLPGYAHEKLTT